MIAFLGMLVLATPAGATPLSFEDAVHAMLGRDTEVRAVAAEAEAAEDIALGKRYHFLPTIALSGTESWSTEASKATSLLGTATVPLFRFGSDVLASDAADAHARSLRARLARTRLDREKKAVDALLEFIRATESRKILDALETMGKESVGIAERQFSGGRIAAQEVDKVRIDLEDTRFQKAEAEQAWVEASAAVESLLGNSDVVAEFPWKARIETVRAPAIDPREVLPLRPEWIEAEAESRATETAGQSAGRALLPELAARVEYGWTKNPLLSDYVQSGWVGSLTVSIPFFSGFRDYAGYRYQADTARAVESRMEGVKRDVVAETRSVPSRYEIARKNALERESILRMSKRLYQDNLSRFRQGRATSDELNVDLNRYLKTELGSIGGWVSAHQAYVDLAHLRGDCATDCGARP